MLAHKLRCRGRLGSMWVQSGHLKVEFLVRSGLVQFTLCSRRCLRGGGGVRFNDDSQDNQRAKGRSFWRDDVVVASVFTKHLHCCTV